MMSRSRGRLIVGTRGSALALAQTRTVVAALHALHPGLEIRVERIATKGDVMRDVPLAALGGRGVFVDAIEEALRTGAVDLAVHSAKDLPSRVPPDMAVAAFVERADPRDVLVSRAGRLDELPAGARVGTSSQRRSCQLLAARHDLTVMDLRGNVDTRLRKLDEGAYDAIVLAGAGLQRLGLEERITEWICPSRMLPSPGQGALALETRADDTESLAFALPLSHMPTTVALTAERAFLSRLGVGCSAAVGAYATVDENDRLTLEAMIGAADGRSVRGCAAAEHAHASALGAALADRLLAGGGRELAAVTEWRSGV